MKLKKYLLVGLSVLTLSACTKDFLNDVTPKDGSISDDLVFNSKIGVDNAMTGIYYLLRNYQYTSSAQNMYGYKTIQFNFDMRGNDLISDSGTWWLYENNWSDNNYGRIATANRNAQIWNLFYKVINNANAIIKNTPSVPATDAEKAQFLAEARALRGYAYFNLARVYQFTYAKDVNAAGVPISLEPTVATTTGKPRSSMKDVYAQVVSDLEFATTTLTTARVDKYRINKNVAAGMLAEVYQEMGMADPSLWAKAVTNAQTARTGFNLMSGADYKAGFNSVTNTEWLWGLQFNASQSLSYASFFGYIEPTNTPNTSFKTRYNDIYVNSTFVSLFSSTDIRNTFLPFTSTATYKKFTTYKFQDNSSQSGDYVMMRAAEMYLIEAEADAQQNLLETAKDVLYVLQKQRDPNAVRSTAATQADLINEILVERRKELYAEIGVEYFDLKRYQRGLVRNGIQWSLLNIPATDNRWRWQIPQTEMDSNKSLTAADQNPL